MFKKNSNSLQWYVRYVPQDPEAWEPVDAGWLPLKSLKDDFGRAFFIDSCSCHRVTKVLLLLWHAKSWAGLSERNCGWLRSNETDPLCYMDLSASLCRIPCLQVTSQHYSSPALALTLAEMRVLIQLKSSWCRCSEFATPMMLSSYWQLSKGHRC